MVCFSPVEYGVQLTFRNVSTFADQTLICIYSSILYTDRVTSPLFRNE